ncbi:MAG: folate family ECF transporter S component [Bacillota bacterium]
MQIRRLTWMGLLVALSIVLTRLFSFTIPIGGTTALRLGFGPIPIVIAGLLMGPVAGIIVGAVADLLGFLLNPMGGLYLPDFTLISMVTGLIPALVYRAMGKGLHPRWKVTISVIINQVITTLILTPLVLQYRFKMPLAVTLPMRLAAQAILIPAYSLIIWIVCSRVASAFPQFRDRH